ncbi:MAG: hypothetical protein AAFX08_06830 [Pseudomonadota bacterium]
MRRIFLGFLATGLAAACGQTTETGAKQTSEEPKVMAEGSAPTGEAASNALSTGAMDEGGAIEAKTSDPNPEEDFQLKDEVRIEDLDFLKEVTFSEETYGLRASPATEEPEGRLAFVLPEGAGVETYKGFAQFIGGKGWGVDILHSGTDAAGLETFANKDECTIVGTVGDGGMDVLDFGYERRETVDGAILVGFVRPDDTPYKKKLPIVLISGGQDKIATYASMAAQYPIYPAQTYLLTIREANHSGYYDDATFDGDGRAMVTPAHQRLILGETVANMLDRLCLTRETRLAEEAREAAREAAKANAEAEAAQQD